MIWFIYLLVYLIMYALNLVLVPFISLFTSDSWPLWAYWWSTPDNPPEGDKKFLRENPIRKTKFQRYIGRVLWLYRNPLVGFCYSILGFRPSILDIEENSGNPKVGDRRGISGYYFQAIYRKKRLAAWQYYAIIKWSDTKCMRVRLGWKLSSYPVPKVGDKFQFVCTITPIKAFGSNA